MRCELLVGRSSFTGAGARSLEVGLFYFILKKVMRYLMLSHISRGISPRKV